MTKFILRRLWTAFPVLILITMINFTIMNLAPGDAAAALVNPEEIESANPEFLAAMRRQVGLDQPLPVRYVKWLGQLVQGNLGYSLRYKDAIADRIAERFPRALLLMGTSMAVSMTLGIIFGMIAALKQYSVADYSLTTFAFLGISIPGFFAALAALYLFSLRLRWFPSHGMTSHNPEYPLWDLIQHMVLPVAILSVEGIAGWLRLTRTTMLEVLHQEYITTARAKGLGERMVIVRHALRSTLIPLVTSLGLHLPGLLGGSVLVETVFAWPGMGLLGIDAIRARDYPVMMATNLMFAVLIMGANIITDILYAYVDPRVRLE